ncbi:hypothetical protein AD952_08575 [Acetobacter cerevisiae]|uniref:DUF4440 domain-containing protein n=2 Tax=Acetobacter cerevisiae TaxID=178900 RepID=A0A149UUK6_9PROT|nr:hypothetical protein AD952_08575 [Acetobacter cerevisiae]
MIRKSLMHIIAAARKEIVDLHVLLQNWFCGEGVVEPRAILDHFTPDYQMVGAAGRPISREAFAGALPKLFGSRPGLVMEIEDVAVIASFKDGHLVTYKEIQTQNGNRNERWSVVMFRTGSAQQVLLWQYLQETFLAV